MKTSELTGALLDYWAARALGYQTDISTIKPGGDWCAMEMRQVANVAAPDFGADPSDSACGIAMVPNAMREFPACIIGHKIGRGKIPYRSSWFYPSSVWTHGGPIVERERMKIEPLRDGAWTASARDMNHQIVGAIGSTVLVAAMRAYVISKFGDEVSDDAAIQAAAQGEKA